MIYKLRNYLFGPPSKWEEYERVVDKKGRIRILFIDKEKGRFKKVYLD